jgi:hypothetical protein
VKFQTWNEEPGAKAGLKGTKMPKDANGFDLDENGNISVRPLMGFTLAPVQGMFCVARLEYPQTVEDMRTGNRSAVQLTMTAVQLREVAAALLRSADQLESAPLPTSSN